MFLYINFRKISGLICAQGFHHIEKLGPYVVAEIKAQVGSNSPELIKELQVLSDQKGSANLTDLRKVIQKYEEWAEPIYGKALIHDVQEHNLIKDSP